MPTLTIPNIPEGLMEKMERRASVNGHPVEVEALFWLQSAENRRVVPNMPHITRKRTPEEEAELDRKLRRLHASLPRINTDDDEINRYKREGRL